MEVQPFVIEDETWVPAVGFTDREDSLLAGTVSFPVPAFLTADGAIRMVQSADRLIAWATGMKQGALARIIVEQARSLPAGQAERFASIALSRTRTRSGRLRTTAELRACLRRLREQLHPESLTARKEAAQRERGVWFRAEPDGMCTLSAFLTAEVGMAIYSGLDRDARMASARAAELRDLPVRSAASEPGTAPESGTSLGYGPAADSPTLSEFRAEALAYRLFGGREFGRPDKLFGSPDGVESGVFRPEILVTIPVAQVMGGSPGSGGGTVPAEPGLGTAELEGYGLLDAATARRLAALAPTWYLLFTDGSTGQALGVGRRAYRPPKALRRYLQCRDGTCRFPGCARRVSVCEPDHTIEWQDGGTTDPGNLAMLCRRHHALKSIGAWSYRHSSPSGDLEWRSPRGRRYTTGPAAIETLVHPSQQPEPPPL